MKVTIPGDQPINLQSGDTLTFTWTTTMSPDGPTVSSDTYCLPVSYDDYGLPIPAGPYPPAVKPPLDQVPASEMVPPVKHRLQLLELE